LAIGPSSPAPDAFALYPPPSFPLDPADIHADLVLPRNSSAGRPYTVINAVSTLDGRAALEGKSSTVGSAADRVIMRNIRCAFDAVLVGAGTLRAENLDLAVPQGLAQRRREKGLHYQPIPIILMGASPLPKARRLYERKGVVILGPRTVRAEQLPANASFRALPVGSGSSMVEIGVVLRVLGEEFEVRSLLVEGGPAVNHSFLLGDHVDELFLTLAPGISGGGDAPNIVSGPSTVSHGLRGARLVSVHAVAGGELYLRYRL
jgi:riboflavin-specific deaminase-like protein